MANRDVAKNNSTTRVTTTSATYQDALTLTWTPATALKDYYLLWSALVDYSTISSDVQTKLIDSTGISDLCVMNFESQDTTDRSAAFGLAKWTSPSPTVSQSFKIQYASEAAAGTAGCSEMVLWAIESHTSDQYIGTDASTTTASATFVAGQTLTFTPATQGDYLIIAYCEIDAPNVAVQLTVDASASHAVDPFEQRDSSNWHPYMAVHKANLTATSHDIKIEFRATGGGTAELRRRRILAIRLDTLRSDSASYTATRSTTTSITAVDAASTTFTADGSVDYFAIGNIILDANNTTISTNAQLSMDGAVAGLHIREMNATANEYSYTALSSSAFASGSRTVKTQVYSETAALTTGYAYSGVYVLDLREAGGGGGGGTALPVFTYYYLRQMGV